MQMLMSKMRSAIQQYNMIEDGDHIAVGVSGGKDSMALLCGLQGLQRFYLKRFTLQAITLDPRFYGDAADYTAVEELCRRMRIPYHIERTDLWEIIFQKRRETNPCSLCARMRRGILHNTAKACGCNKIALGHHLNDAAETLYMNLFNNGRINCFSPVSYLSRKKLMLIRPLIFTYEKEVRNAVKHTGFPVVKSKCPVDGQTERQQVKELLGSLTPRYGDICKKTVDALRRAGIDGW